ncbi:GapS6a family protein [Pseudoalteromonas piscicida]|uniref:GapS6a family protein n=1 Tax=Pseudoalteromonas piscicida TaxID=43662 RepID=UPI0032BF8075
MDGFTTSILASATYSLISKGAEITASTLKTALQKWLLPDSDLEKIVNSVNEAQIDEDWSERKIEKHFNTLPELLEIISKTKANQNATINQTHSGTGNNEAHIKF